MKTLPLLALALVVAGCTSEPAQPPETLDPTTSFHRFTLADVPLPTVGQADAAPQVLDGLVVSGTSCVQRGAGPEPSEAQVPPAAVTEVQRSLVAQGWTPTVEGTHVTASRGPWSLTGALVPSPTTDCAVGWVWSIRQPTTP